MGRAAEETIARFGLGEEGLAAWRAAQLPEDRFDDWLTDRVARRPTGARARAVYGADDVHDFARRAILDALDLRPGDRLLDVGCGGGLLLRDAAGTGAVLTGLDHSEEMVRLARERAPGAEVMLGQAERLPFADAAFTAVSMSVVFFFFADPVTVLRECVRVLEAGRPARALHDLAGAARHTRRTGADREPRALPHRCRAGGVRRRRRARRPVVDDDDGGQLLTAKRLA